MRSLAAGLLLGLAACGRIGFDEPRDAGLAEDAAIPPPPPDAELFWDHQTGGGVRADRRYPDPSSSAFQAADYVPVARVL